ncbi:MAG: hypothetical protein P1V35_10335, partial [Planctomycetota bacterium]|nr:hypothetical protein [Planctomycetota bacterium]
MLQTIQRFVFVALLLSLAPPTRAQEFAPRSETPQLTEARRLLQDNSDPPFSPEDLRTPTPWSLDHTLFRYRQAAAALWGNKRWPEGSVDGWELLAAIAGPIRGDSQAVKKIQDYFLNWVGDLPDSDMLGLGDHLRFLAEGVPANSVLWIELQSWSVTLLTDFLLWEQAIPLLQQIESTLWEEESAGGSGIRSFYAHLDCSSAYHGLGIREKVMEHLERSEEWLSLNPSAPHNSYRLGHLLLFKLQVLHVYGNPEDIISLLDAHRSSEEYLKVNSVIQADCDFNYRYSQVLLGDASVEDLESDFQRILALTNPTHPDWEPSYEGTRWSCQRLLSRL